MRALFFIGSKLLGIFMFYVGLMYLVTGFVLGDYPFPPALLQLLLAALLFGIAFVLAFRTEWLARLLAVADDEGAANGRVEAATLLRTGVVLIGIYVFLTRVGPVLNDLAFYLDGVRFGGFGGALLQIAVKLVPLTLALFFVFRADRVVEFIAAESTGVSGTTATATGNDDHRQP